MSKPTERATSSMVAMGSLAAVTLAVGTLLNGVGQGSFAVNAMTIRQLASTDAMRSRATAVHRFVSWGALPVGALLAGLISTIDLRATLVTAAVVSFTCFVPLLRSPLTSAGVVFEHHTGQNEPGTASEMPDQFTEPRA